MFLQLVESIIAIPAAMNSLNLEIIGGKTFLDAFAKMRLLAESQREAALALGFSPATFATVRHQ